jgi:hypothetical protein
MTATNTHIKIYHTEYLPEQLQKVNNTILIIKNLLPYFKFGNEGNRIMVYFVRSNKPTLVTMEGVKAFTLMAQDGNEILSYSGMQTSRVLDVLTSNIKFIVIIYDLLNQEDEFNKTVMLSHELQHVKQFIKSQKYSYMNSALNCSLGKACHELPMGIDADRKALRMLSKLYGAKLKQQFISLDEWDTARKNNITPSSYDWIMETRRLWNNNKISLQQLCSTTNFHTFCNLYCSRIQKYL